MGPAGPPQLVAFVASDNMQQGVGPNIGDVLQLRFDRATDMGGYNEDVRFDQKKIDQFFVFTQPSSLAFQGAQASWLDSSTFQITLGGGDNSGVGLEVGRSNVSVRALDCHLNNMCLRTRGQVDAAPAWDKLSPPTVPAANVTLSGSLGTLAAPELVAFVPFDPDDAGAEYG